MAALLAYLGDPLVDRLEACGLKRTPAVILVFSVILLLLVLSLIVLLPLIEAQIGQLMRKLPVYLEWARSHVVPRIQALLPGEATQFDLGLLQRTLASHWREAGGLLANAWSTVFGLGPGSAWLACEPVAGTCADLLSAARLGSSRRRCARPVAQAQGGHGVASARARRTRC